MTGRPSGQAPHGLGWLAQVRSAAMVLAGHGRPVLRGTYYDGGVWRGRRPHGADLRPVDEDWSTGWTVRAGEAAR